MAARNTEDVSMRLKLEKGRQFKQGVDGAGKSVRNVGKDAQRTAARMKLLNKANDRINRSFAAVRKGAALAGTALAGAAVLGLKASITNASNLNEELTKTRAIFGSSSKAIERFADTSAKALGMTKEEALGFSGQIGGLFKNAGNSAKDAAGLSKNIVGLSSDLASFFNSAPDEAFLALRSGLSGESEPLRRFNVFLSETAVQAEAAKMGLKKTNGQLTQQQKVMVRYKLIMQQTKDAQGDFGRTSDGLANQQRILRAQLTNLSAKIGTALLPTVNKAIKAVNKFVEQFDKGVGAGGRFRDKLEKVGDYIKTTLWPTVKKIVKAVASFTSQIHLSKGAVTAILGALAGFIIFVKIVKMITAVQAAWVMLNLAFTASPIGLIVVGVIALGVALFVAYKKVKWFHDAVNAVWKFLKKSPLSYLLPIGLLAHIIDNFDRIVGFVKKLPGRVASAATGLWDGLKGGFVGVMNWIIGKINWMIRAFNNTAGRIPGVDNIGELGKLGDDSAGNGGTAPSLPGTGNTAGPPAPSRRGNAVGGNPVAPIRLQNNVSVQLDGAEVGHKMLKRTRDSARRRG